MDNLIKRFTNPIGAVLVIGLFLITTSVIIMPGISHAGNGKQTQSGKLVTIHDRDTEKVILSQSETIGDALKEAGITIDSKDAVEPALTEKMVASDYQVNVYRARPVVIVDGNTRTKVVTPYQTAAQIAESAGVKLYSEDIAKIDRTDNIIAEGAGLKLTIDRAIPFTFTLYGNTSTVRTQATTVGGMLAEKGIKLGKDDKSSLPSSSNITENMALKVWREGKQTITVTEEINFEVQKIEAADREMSYYEIKTAGIKGSRNATYEVIIQDGKEVSRTEIASLTTKQPEKQIEIVGVKGQYTTPSENETITWNFLISNGFSRVQAAGIMGNIMQEHGFNTSGDGLVQWTGGRKAALMSRPNPYNIYTQLDFLMYELNGSYSGVRDAIKASGSLEESVQIFQNRFERCGICRESERIQSARNILASH